MLTWGNFLIAMKSDMGVFIAILFLWLGFLLGGAVMRIQNCRNHCYTFWTDKAKINPYDPTPHMSAGVEIGLVAGWYAATSEEKDAMEVRNIYLKKIEEEGLLDESLHSGD